MKTYRAAVVGCSRMGGFIDNEVHGIPSVVRPYSHAAGYEACNRTDLIACSDLRTDVLAEFGKRYNIPESGRYTDYKELIQNERPDIVSIATQPEQRAEIALFAIEHGVKALYCEKALCASMDEANAIAEAVKRNGVVFNMGTNRRWDPGFDAAMKLVDEGAIGEVRSIIIYANGTLFNTASHNFDVAQRFAGDGPADWVQGYLPAGDTAIDGDILRQDPEASATIAFRNGVKVYALMTHRASEWEIIGTAGTITAKNNGRDWELRRKKRLEPVGQSLDAEPFPHFEPASSTLRLIEDIVHALDTGEPTRGGAEVARLNSELIFACIESHRRGGARIELPLRDSKVRLARQEKPRPIRVQP